MGQNYGGGLYLYQTPWTRFTRPYQKSPTGHGRRVCLSSHCLSLRSLSLRPDPDRVDPRRPRPPPRICPARRLAEEPRRAAAPPPPSPWRPSLSGSKLAKASLSESRACGRGARSRRRTRRPRGMVKLVVPRRPPTLARTVRVPACSGRRGRLQIRRTRPGSGAPRSWICPEPSAGSSTLRLF
jgi:hypothetical protein